jgi:AcrR family transcriptional regulator
MMPAPETLPETKATGLMANGKSDRAGVIVAAAYDLIDAGGLEELTIRAVLKRTGLARRAFYELFAGKDDLVLAVFEHAMSVGADMYRTMVAPLDDPLERLQRMIISIGHGAIAFEEADNSRHMAAALSREHLRLAESRPDELHQALQPLITLIADQLAEGMAAGKIRPGEPARFALFIYNLVATTMHTELIAEEAMGSPRERRGRLADDLWEFCRRAVVV